MTSGLLWVSMSRYLLSKGDDTNDDKQETTRLGI